ncbi:MAG: hypothetical protein ACLFU8_06055 [Anaerolineales bacterium]
MANWQHCRLQGNRVTFLGARGVFENKKDAHMSARAAFDTLEDEGWELVTVLPDPEGEGEFIYFFKRPVSE